MKRIIVIILPLCFGLSAYHQSEGDPSRRFIAGVGQGILAVPLTPLAVCALPAYGPEALDRWAHKTKDEREEERKANPWTRGDKAEAIGFTCSYIGTIAAIFRMTRFLK